MTIAMCWLIAGVLMLICALVWLLGPFGLLAGGAMCVAVALILAPDRPGRVVSK